MLPSVTRTFASITLLATALLISFPALAQTVVPVSAGRVVLRDMPIYADGIGTVAANQLADVRAQVGGIIDKIAFTEGSEVKQGDLLAEIDPRPYQATLDQAEAKRQSDQAALLDAERNLKRDAYLVKTKDVAQQTLDTQGATVSEDAANVAGDEATIASAKVNLEFTRITAPISGRVGLRQVDLGNLVSATDTTPLTTVAEIHPISVLFTLPQDQINAITKVLGGGTPAQVLAMSADNQTLLATGTLVTADNQIDTTTGTIKLKASFQNLDNHLWPGEFVNVRLLVSTLRNALTVPSAAVQRSPDGPFLYVIGSDKTASVRAVTLGPDDGTTAVIASGVAAGDTIVTNGTARLSDGATVQIRADQGPAT